MEYLYPRVLEYSQGEFEKQRNHYQKLAEGQAPKTLLVTCSDSRLCPQEFSQTNAGELFVIRNAGNLVPAYDEKQATNEGLTLEYGVKVLKVKEIVVSGHVSCGAMQALMQPEQLKDLPLVQQKLTVYKQSNEDYFSKKPELPEVIEWNVKKQIENLLTYPFVKQAVDAGELFLWGWVYDFVNGKVVHKISHKELGEGLQ